MTIRKSLSILVAAAAAAAFSGLGGCAAFNAAPSAAQVQTIDAACAADAIVRPTITDLLPLATAVEQGVVKDAEGVIDQVCANPTATPAANIAAAFSADTAKITAMVVTLTARKLAAATAAAAAKAASAASSA